MKKTTLFSIMTVTLLLTGCNNATVKDAADKVGEATNSAIDTVGAKTSGAMDVARGKASEAVEAAGTAADAAAAAAAARAREAAATIKEKAAEAVEAAREKAVKALDATKAKIAETTVAAVDKMPGKALYTRCAGCHGTDGHTRALGKSDPIAGKPAAEITADLQGYKAGTLNKHTMGSLMKGQAASLSDAEIQALSAYISALK